jgi:chromosome segregation ATPase
MARSAAIGEGQWFELADALAGKGEPPSVKALHAMAKERFGVAASFTTIQRILESWRRLGGTARPTDLGPQALEIVLKSFTPLYQQLLAQARSEFEPRIIAAEELAQEATVRSKSLEAELHQLRDERQHLREQLQIAGEREREHAGALASASTRVVELQGSLESAASVHQQQLMALETRLRDQEERHSRQHTQLVEEQRIATIAARVVHETEVQALGERHSTEIERLHTELTSLREALQEAQQARSTLGAQKQASEQQLTTAAMLQAQLQARLDQITDELASVHARRQRSEQALRDARAVNTQMEAAYQQRINQLQTQLDALVQGQASIQQHVATLVEEIVQRRQPGP